MIFSRKSASAASDRYGFDPGLDERPEIPVPDFGPYDVQVAPEDDLVRLDLGALHVPNVADVALQLEAAPNGQIVRVQLEHQGSRLQLGAFAAPRTEGIWDELRDELRRALLGNGAKVVEVDGPYGPQLAARMTGGGQGAGVMEVRHIGIDGPRWFVHAVMIGPAAADPDQAGPLHDVLRGLVVDRGSEARPVKEALPLRLPPEYASQLAEAAQAQAAQAEAGPVAAGPVAAGSVAAGSVAAGPAARTQAPVAAATESGPPTGAAVEAPPASKAPAKAPAKARPRKTGGRSAATARRTRGAGR